MSEAAVAFRRPSVFIGSTSLLILLLTTVFTKTRQCIQSDFFTCSSFHSYTVLCGCEPFGPELVAFLRVFCMKEGGSFLV